MRPSDKQCSKCEHQFKFRSISSCTLGTRRAQECDEDGRHFSPKKPRCNKLFTDDGRWIRVLKSKGWTASHHFGRTPDRIILFIDGKEVKNGFDSTQGLWLHFWEDNGPCLRMPIFGSALTGVGNGPEEAVICDICRNGVGPVHLFTKKPEGK
jgi:hypothetical protein